MVSFWPFRSNDTSSAGFEKILSSLTEKINKVSAKDARLRAQQRRLRVLWTLYSTFIYLAALLILLLVVGRRHWTATEYTSLAGSPFGIYLVRLTIDTIFNYRIAGTQSTLDDLQRQRNAAIEKLKAATKYNSTQQLLDKYSGTEKKPKAASSSPNKKHGTPTQQKRTGLPPPPTANIPQPGPPSLPRSPPQQQQQQPMGLPPSPVSASFAPNAFPSPPHLQEQRWYDRLLDAVLGEDETSAKNRIVLLCQSCRLVNGQAPPGTRSLDDLGRWRCVSCGAMNGRRSETDHEQTRSRDSGLATGDKASGGGVGSGGGGGDGEGDGERNVRGPKASEGEGLEPEYPDAMEDVQPSSSSVDY